MVLVGNIKGNRTEDQSHRDIDKILYLMYVLRKCLLYDAESGRNEQGFAMSVSFLRTEVGSSYVPKQLTSSVPLPTVQM